MKIIKRSLQFSLIFAGLLFLFQSCSKVEGPGGSSSIAGKVRIEVYDIGGTLINSYDAPGEDVYLIYGEDGTFYDDDVETSYDGSFEFNFLQKGKYQLFVYQDCNTCPSGKDVVLVDVEIADNKSTTDIGTITIID
ncbi:MAG: hypothetical protein AB8B56_12400 [Crocinitomicaceae bacterium]